MTPTPEEMMEWLNSFKARGDGGWSFDLPKPGIPESIRDYIAATRDNLLDIDMIPLGYVFLRMQKGYDRYVCSLRRDEPMLMGSNSIISGDGPTPRAAFDAALEKIVEEN